MSENIVTKAAKAVVNYEPLVLEDLTCSIPRVGTTLEKLSNVSHSSEFGCPLSLSDHCELGLL
jgi:hypothetical protein